MNQFERALVDLNNAFEGNFASMRTKVMLAAALAVTDKASVADRKGVLVTEDEWLDLCRKIYFWVRTVRPGGSN
jgi:hypothetical protein